MQRSCSGEAGEDATRAFSIRHTVLAWSKVVRRLAPRFLVQIIYLTLVGEEKELDSLPWTALQLTNWAGSVARSPISRCRSVLYAARTPAVVGEQESNPCSRTMISSIPRCRCRHFWGHFWRGPHRHWLRSYA